MNDVMIRGISRDGSLRFMAVDSTATVRKAARIHDLSTTNTLIMGRMLTAALLFAADLKSAKDLVTLKLETDGPINFLVFDVIMPVMSGLELIDELAERNITIPALAITGSSYPKVIQELRAKGHEDFLEKPFNTGQLLDRIGKVLEGK